MSSGSEGDELTTPGVPVLGINSHTPIDEVLALSAHLVAKASVDAVVREAVEELARAVAGATQWLAEAVRGELVSQAVAAAEPSESRSSVENEEEHEQPPPKELPKLDGPSTLTDRPPSAAIHAVAKAAVDAVTREAVSDIVQAVERATEWVTQAVGNELVSEAVEPEEAAALHDATEWIPEAVRVELAAHAVADAVPSSEAPTVVNEPEEFSGTLDVAVPRLAVQVGAPSVADVRALAEATAVGAVSTALQNITRALGDASTWLAQAVRGELLAQAVVDASPDDGRQADEADNNSTSLEEPSQPRRSTLCQLCEFLLRQPLPSVTSLRCHSSTRSSRRLCIKRFLPLPLPRTSPRNMRTTRTKTTRRSTRPPRMRLHRNLPCLQHARRRRTLQLSLLLRSSPGEQLHPTRRQHPGEFAVGWFALSCRH